MNRTSNIKQICHNRGIKILVHFTPIENLRRILGEGLLSRNALERRLDQQPTFNDQNRLDKHPEAICLSIGFPNYKMFFKYASEKQSQWVVLLLDAKLLWELDCAFCQENAASNAVYTIPLKERKKPDALNNMFIDYDSISRQSLSIPDHYPTYPQAEVLVCNPIPVAYIKKVHFYEKLALEQWYSKNSGMDTETFLVSKQYFHPRCDWKVWTDEAERQRQKQVAEEAERQRQKQAAEEAERQRQKQAAEEAEKQRQKQAAEEAERQRQKQAAEEAERQRQERAFIAHVGYELSPVEVNAKNKYGNTPLHIAATENAHQTAEVLLIHDAEVNAKNEYGSTSLHIAAYKNAYQTVKVLLIHDAEVNAKDKDGDTPLHNAALKNAYQTAEVLLNQGADVNAKNKDGETPLHFALSNNAREIAEVLHRYGGSLK